MVDKHYLVKWEIDIVADNCEEAARTALEIQRDPYSSATYFTTIDRNGKEINVELPYSPMNKLDQDDVRRIFNENQFYLGGFVDKLLISAMCADADNFEALRPALTTILIKYELWEVNNG